MSKRKKQNPTTAAASPLPADAVLDLAELHSETAPAPEAPAPRELRIESASIEVPLTSEVQGGVYITRHVEVVLDTPQAATLRQLIDALEARGARLDSGRACRSAADAVRWLLEELARPVPKAA